MQLRIDEEAWREIEDKDETLYGLPATRTGEGLTLAQLALSARAFVDHAKSRERKPNHKPKRRCI